MIRIPSRRTLHSAGGYAAKKVACGRSLKIMIRCGLLRDGFHWPILIFRKAKGLNVLNPTTRIYENRIFNRYFKKQIIANYIVLNRFYRETAGFGKPNRPKFAPGRSFPILFPPISAGHYIYVDRIQYLNRLFGRHENKDQAQKNRVFFAESKNIKNAVSGKPSIIIPQKKSGKSANSIRIARRADAGQTEPITGFPNPEIPLIVREVFSRKDRAGSTLSGIPEVRSAFMGNGLSSTQKIAHVLERSGSLGRLPAEDRIFRMIAECSAVKDRGGTGQAFFPSRSSMLFEEGAGLRETGLGRIGRLFSGSVAVLAGNKAVSAPMPSQTGRMQKVRPVLNEEGQVFSRVVSDKSIDISIPQPFDTFRNTLGSPDGVRPEFSRTGFGQGNEATHFPGKSGALEGRAAQLFKEVEVSEKKSALKRSEPEQVGFILPGAERHGSGAPRSVTRIRNGPAGEDTAYLNKKRDGVQSVPHERRMIAPVTGKYALQVLPARFQPQETSAADQAASGTPVGGLKTAEQNKRFTTQIIAQSRRIFNRAEQTNTLKSGLQKETGRQQHGMRRMGTGMDSVSAFQKQTKSERSEASSANSFSGRVPDESELTKESRPGRSMPSFAEVVYQKQGIGRAFSAGRHAASALNGPGPGVRGPEFVLKKEETPGRPLPASRQAKEVETAEYPAQTIYEYDDKKHQTREINVIADRVYKILEKRIAVERDRRGLA